MLLVSFWSYGQVETEADFRRQVYSQEMTGGFMIHSRGYGINIRRTWFTDGYTKMGLDFDFVSIRHPKEVKFQSQYFISNSKSFVYGKINSFYSMRLGIGRDKILVDKTDKGTISISWIFFGGGSFGMLKPVYLDVVKYDESNQPYTTTERYDPRIHNYSDIYGQAPFFTGIEKTSLRMGLYAKTGFAFDFNLSDKKITTIEVGAVFDYFPAWGVYQAENVPIMWNTENYAEWLQFYLTINFGGKWN